MTYPEPIAIVGISAIMPDAPDADTFWGNIRNGVYSISDVPTERAAAEPSARPPN